MILITDKDLMDETNDDSLAGLQFALNREFDALSSVNGNNVYDISTNSSGRLYPENAEGRAGYIPEQFLGKYKCFNRLTVVKNPPISEENKLKELLLFVNMPIAFSDIYNEFPNSVAVGYAYTKEEANRFRKACGVDDALILSPFTRQQRNVLEYGRYGALSWVNYLKDILSKNGFITLTNVNVNGIIGEVLRKLVLEIDLEKDDNSTKCSLCHPSRHYRSAELSVIEHSDISDFYSYSLLQEIISDIDEYPILGKIGKLCTYNDYFHPGLGRTGFGCEYEDREITKDAIRKFREQYKTLEARIKV